MHCLGEKQIWTPGSWVSGLWQKMHRSGHPLKKTTLRIPGPSSRLCLLISTIRGMSLIEYTESVFEIPDHEAEFEDVVQIAIHLYSVVEY